MIRAAAVLTCLPSPSGLGGTGDSGNVTFGGVGCVDGEGVDVFDMARVEDGVPELFDSFRVPYAGSGCLGATLGQAVWCVAWIRTLR